ncbi:MAG TPA: hypothetical protein VHW09_17620 [Bryobacteraceae bacterium]|nr:hypothetical protein [Bryobacteraceae bacterium]
MAWKFYAWAILVLAVVTLAGRMVAHFYRPASTGTWDLCEAALNFVLLPALFGFAYRRAILPHLFWEITVPLAWMAFVYGQFSPTHRKLAREKGFRVAVAASLGSFAVNLPGMWAITMYAYASSDLWR